MKAPWYRDAFSLSVGLALILGIFAVLEARAAPSSNNGFMVTLFLSNIQLVAALVVLRRRLANLETILTDEGALGRLKSRQVDLPDINPLRPAKAE